MRWFDWVLVITVVSVDVVVGLLIWSSPADASKGPGHAEIKLILTTIGLSGGIITAYLALRNLFINTQNRIDDVRWKRAEAARTVLENLFNDEEAYGALRMLEDEPEEQFEYEDDTFPINLGQIETGLNEWDNGSKECRLVRRSFDSLASYLVRVQYFVSDGMVSLDVVQPVLRYSVMRMAQKKEAISKYFKDIGHEKAVEFLKKFREWQNPNAFGPVRYPTGT